MRVMIAVENRFLKTRNGDIYSTTVCDYNFWQRYLQVFDEVIVFARVAEISEDKLNKLSACGPNVSFLALPTFIGPWQHLRQYRKLRIMAKNAIDKADAFILRVPGTVPNLLWDCLKKKNIPYGIEVVGDPWESLSLASVKSIISLVAGYVFRKNLRKQCQDAVAAAYVSKQYLQELYPPGGWSTHYSSLDLPDDAIITEDKLDERFTTLRNAAEGQRPFRICHVGSMSALYKAHDVLIEAIAICKKRNFDLKLTFLGDGRYQQMFMEKARQLDVSDRVDFAGRVPPGQAVIEQLDSADIFVLPSFTEGLPRSLIEAIARGLPCIGTRVGGIRELLSDEDLVVPGDAGELAQKIMAVMRDQKTLEKMARRNLQKAKEYRSSELNKRRVEFYTKVAEVTKTCRAS